MIEHRADIQQQEQTSFEHFANIFRTSCSNIVFSEMEKPNIEHTMIDCTVVQNSQNLRLLKSSHTHTKSSAAQSESFKKFWR